MNPPIYTHGLSSDHQIEPGTLSGRLRGDEGARGPLSPYAEKLTCFNVKLRTKSINLKIAH